MTNFQLPAAEWPLPFWIAHRGAGQRAPENTLAAFRLGAQHGYRAFECDVKLSADGVPFLLHDATLERTTSGQGTASGRDWNALSRLDAGAWHSPAFAGETLPTLDAIAAWLIRNDHSLDLEIKPTPGDEARTGQAVAAAAARLWAGHPHRLLLSSFRPEALQAALEAAPGLPRALLVDTDWPGWFAAAQDLGCAAVITNHRWLDRALIERLHAHGLRALAYTVNEAADAQRLCAAGVDGLITDAVDRFDPSRTPDDGGTG